MGVAAVYHVDVPFEIAADASIAGLSIGVPRTLGESLADDPFDERWTTGIFKAPVEGPVRLGSTGFSGDGQADLTSHGGVDKAVCAYSADHYPAWRAALGVELPAYGAFGENLTIANLDEGGVCVGDLWEAGDVLLQVSQPRQPCWKLARKWRIASLPDQVVKSGRTGWYFRVRREGTLTTGARVILRERPHPEWTVAAANAVMHQRLGDVAALASLDALSLSWRTTLSRRIEAGTSAEG
jgi:MOSC domain-containing protein YiiM